MLVWNIIIGIVLALVVYKMAVWLYYGFKSGLEQAVLLEQMFGRDVVAAARFAAGFPSPQSENEEEKCPPA